MTELVLLATASEKDFTVSTSREYWERIRPAFLTGILVNLLARGQALFGSLYSIDAYFVAKKSFNEEIAYNLADGRFLRALLWRLQELLGFSPLASEAASLALATVALVAAAILFGEAIFGKRASGETMFFVAIFTLHPFLTRLPRPSSGCRVSCPASLEPQRPQLVSLLVKGRGVLFSTLTWWQ